MRKRITITGLVLCVVLAGCSFSNNKGDSGDASAPQAPVTDNSAKTTSKATEKVTEKKTEVNKDADQRVSIVSHSVVKDRNGADSLVIEYAWTNNSDKETSFMFACTDKVYQNGIECPSYGILLDEVDSQQEMTDIKPGTTYNLKIGYTLQDNTNALVEVTDLMGYEYYLKETIDLGGGEGKTSEVTPGVTETTIKISEVFISKDYKDRDVLVVKYEFTNGDDKPHSFSTSFEDKVYQNGVECSSLAVICDDVDSNTTLASIKPGVTTIVEEGYLLNDMSDVEIEVKEWLGDKVYLSEKRSIQ